MPLGQDHTLVIPMSDITRLSCRWRAGRGQRGPCLARPFRSQLLHIGGTILTQNMTSTRTVRSLSQSWPIPL